MAVVFLLYSSVQFSVSILVAKYCYEYVILPFSWWLHNWKNFFSLEAFFFLDICDCKFFFMEKDGYHFQNLHTVYIYSWLSMYIFYYIILHGLSQVYLKQGQVSLGSTPKRIHHIRTISNSNHSIVTLLSPTIIFFICTDNFLPFSL